MSEQETGFEVIYTTADLGLRIKAYSIEDIFTYGACGLFFIMYENWKEIPAYPGRINEKHIHLENHLLSYLFVDWLNELVFLNEAEHFIPSTFHIGSIAKNHSWVLHATAAQYPTKDPHLKKKIEVKAATYHHLELTNDGTLWQLEIILDV
jgi:SHS2 domain-containing protein